MKQGHGVVMPAVSLGLRGTHLEVKADMEDLIQIILRFGPAELATEESACNAVVAVRFPNGIVCRCGASCTRNGAYVQCTRKRHPHRFTILTGTAFGTKRVVSVRAILTGMRAFAVTHRGLSARELAREMNMSHVTIWRHLHTLRALIPKAHAVATNLAAVAKLSKTSGVRAGGTVALQRDVPKNKGAMCGAIAQNVRTWVNGTFHGVSHEWLPLYLREMAARWTFGARYVIGELLSSLIHGGAVLRFADTRPAKQQLTPLRHLVPIS